MVEYMVSEHGIGMFSKGTIYGLLEYLFGDMADDQKELIGPLEFDSEDEDC
jgi:hypothetical protein